MAMTKYKMTIAKLFHPRPPYTMGVPEYIYKDEFYVDTLPQPIIFSKNTEEYKISIFKYVGPPMKFNFECEYYTDILPEHYTFEFLKRSKKIDDLLEYDKQRVLIYDNLMRKYNRNLLLRPSAPMRYK